MIPRLRLDRPVEERHPLRLSTACMTLAAMLLLALGLYVYRSYHATVVVMGREFRMRELAGQVVHLGEALTMSARMAAFTDDREWERRYRRDEPALDRVVQELAERALSTAGTQAAAWISSVRRTLAEMEHRVLELVRAGRLAEAQAVVLSDDYRLQQDRYAQGIEELASLARRRTDAALSRQQRGALISLAAVLTILAALLVGSLLLFSILRRWQRALSANHRELALKARELEQVNASLDARVTERTTELRNVNRELEREIAERETLERQLIEQRETLRRGSRELAGQQQVMQVLVQQLQASTRKLEGDNRELTRRAKIMQSLLEDLSAAKARIEQQGETLGTANRKLKELAALKDEFVAMVSHELRTPLTSVKEGLSLMLDGALGQTTPEQREFLGTINADLDRLTELINNMLDISKIEAGRMRLARVRLDALTLVHSLVRSYGTIAGRRTVRTEADGAPVVFGDPHRLLQVLTNLFSNALKFTPEDGAITFRLRQRNGIVSIAVEDTGPGVPPEELPKLFQKFSQVGSPQPGAPRGTGLGLVISKELTEMHGGQIEVASQVGVGTTFTVRLPAYTDALALAESFRQQARAAADEGQGVALLAVQAWPFVDCGSEDAPSRRAALERITEEVRQQLHRGDLVLPIEPSWVVALSVTDARGASAIMRRLRGTLRGGGRLQLGAAVFPDEAREATALFERARSQLDQGLASIEREQDANATIGPPQLPGEP